MGTMTRTSTPTTSPALLIPGDSFRVFGRTFTAQDYPTGETTIHVRDHENRADVLLHIPSSVKIRILEDRAADRVDLEDVRVMDTIRITRHDSSSFTGVVRAVDESHVRIARKFEASQTIGRNAIQGIEILNR